MGGMRIMVKTTNYFLKFSEYFYHPIHRDVKTSTIRDEPKPLNINDCVIATFQNEERLLPLCITNHYAKRVKDLDNNDAFFEGYRHVNLLKHELLNIYPKLSDDDYVYIYIFKRVMGNKEVSSFRDNYEFVDGEWVKKKK